MKIRLIDAFLITTSIFSPLCAAEVLTQKGSNTLINVAEAWAHAYHEVNPAINLKVEGGGSGRGINALINGVVDIANSSRAMSAREIENAKNRWHNPKEHLIGYDALAVFVHLDNPINHLSMGQMAEMYGEEGTISKWSDINIEVPVCDDQDMVLVSRQQYSGTYDYFRSSVVGRDFKLGEQAIIKVNDSKSVVDLIEKNPCAVGYSGLGYATPKVKVVCIVGEDDKPCIYPSIESAKDGSYPIARPLFMYTDGEPKGEVKKYIDWVLSDAGQCILLKEGYAPIRSIKCDLSE